MTNAASRVFTHVRDHGDQLVLAAAWRNLFRCGGAGFVSAGFVELVHVRQQPRGCTTRVLRSLCQRFDGVFTLETHALQLHYGHFIWCRAAVCGGGRGI